MDEADQKAFDDEWDDMARRFIRVEMTRRKLSFADLSEALGRIEVVENERNLRNKVARGSFSARFFLQCLVAMGLSRLDLSNEVWPHTVVVSERIDPSDPRHPDNWVTHRGPATKFTRIDPENE